MKIEPNQREIVDYGKSRALNNLDYLNATFHQHSFPRHFHETYVIEAVQYGIDEFYCRGDVRRATVGDIILINPFEVHSGRPSGDTPLCYRSFYPGPAMLSDICSQIDGSTGVVPYFPRTVVADRSFSRVMLNVLRFLEIDPESLATQTFVHRMLTHLILTYSDRRFVVAHPRSDNGAVRRVREYIQEQYGSAITLEGLAAVSGMSQFHLLRMFQKETGLSPHEYLISVRIERAKPLLTARLPIAQVADAMGFCDQSHFSRHFKRIVGVTPGRFQSC